ncbi:MAG: energy transducer TonB [Sphingomonadales bacterium]|nr:energy transducer TonB [Sphingomonadales bacterium]
MLDFLAMLLVGATPAIADTVPSQAQPHTLQQDFDTASADVAEGKCAKAVPEFEALERNPKVKPGSLSAAATSVRKGQCLVRLGREEEGEAAIEAGLPILAKAGGNFEGDLEAGRIALGEAAITRWDYTSASRAYRSALELEKGDQRILTLAKLAKSTAFDGGTASLDYASEGIQLLSAAAKPDKDSLAAFHTLHARALLNQGQAQAAYSELMQALTLSGGLTSRTTLSEVALRGDLAMAAMQIGRKDDARRYLAYTGAGRIEKSPFASAASMDPPICGEETGLRPDDVAVVDFSIADNGSVTSAQTVYSRGGPAVATAFSKAVSEWYWRPQDVAAIPVFYRLATRVEIRCSNVLSAGPGLFSPLDSRFIRWASSLLPPVAHPSDNPADTATALRAFAEERGKSGDLVARFAALAWLVRIEPSPVQTQVATADEALSLAAKVAIPAEATNWLRITRLRAASASHRPSRADRNAALALAAESDVSKDALAVDTLRLAAASMRPNSSADEKVASSELLLAAAQDGRLPEHHPLRQLAWLRLADLAAAASDRPKAQAYFANTGLTEQQCSLLGVAPTMRRTGASSADYPMEALMMGFEGWVRLEFDINADGRTANARPIVAYPPLIFTDAAKGMMRDVRYDTSYRPGDGVACSANRDTIRFVIPSNH